MTERWDRIAHLRYALIGEWEENAQYYPVVTCAMESVILEYVESVGGSAPDLGSKEAVRDFVETVRCLQEVG